MFAHGGGFGMMGEAGPEAILPLTRTSSGDLGVKAGGSAPNIEFVIKNQTGTEATARQDGPASFNGEKWVIGIVLDAMQRNKGGFANNMKAMVAT